MINQINGAYFTGFQISSKLPLRERANSISAANTMPIINGFRAPLSGTSNNHTNPADLSQDLHDIHRLAEPALILTPAHL